MNENRSLPVLVLVAVLAAALLLGFATPGAALARSTDITQAFDFFHVKQQTSGGFIDSGDLDSANTTPWVVMAIAAGGENPTAWNDGGKDPLDYLQATDLVTKASGSMNAPAFYAKVIMAFDSMNRTELIWSAGTPRADLLSKLLLYRDETDGHFSPATSGDRSLNDVSTTTWAVLAMRAASQARDSELVSRAVAFLVAEQNDDGGWGITSASTSTVDQTAATVQALISAGLKSSAAVTDGVAWLRAHQHLDGGFPSYTSDPKSNAESTAWALQVAVAMGDGLDGWAVGQKTPASFLRSLQRPNGSFSHAGGSTGRSSMMTTTQVVIALAGKTFPFEKTGSGVTPRFLPAISSFKPSAGARFTSTNDVAVSASYADNKGGTGIDKDAVRVLIDGVNRTTKAKVYAAHVKLNLIDVPNGSHTVEIRVKDRAGNTRTAKHTITVAVSTSSTATTTTRPPTYSPSTPSSTYKPPSSTRTPSATTTLYPTPTATPTTGATPSVTATSPGSVTGTPLTPTPGSSLDPGATPLPSPSASVTGAATGDTGGGDSGGIIGGTLLALLPAGAALSYLMHRRQAAALALASEGKVLPGGGSPWQRFKAGLRWTS